MKLMQPTQTSVRPEVMELRTTLTSPFGRKVRMAALVLGLDNRIVMRPADTLDEFDDLRQQNPLGKMPCLIADGNAFYDSRVILEYLDALVGGGGRLIPTLGSERFRKLTHMTLADGVADAALLMVYERRFRETAQVSERWVNHQRGKIERGLTAIAAQLPDPTCTDAVAISLACALGYLDWRHPVDWRPEYPRLTAWLYDFAHHEPAFIATERPR